MNVEPQNDPLAKTTGYQTSVDDSVKSQFTATPTILRALPEVDALTNQLIHNRVTISKRPRRTEILRLTATTPPEKHTSRPSVAIFDLHAPKIVRGQYPEIATPGTGTDGNTQQAVVPVLKANAQPHAPAQLPNKAQLQAKTQLKTIER